MLLRQLFCFLWTVALWLAPPMLADAGGRLLDSRAKEARAMQTVVAAAPSMVLPYISEGRIQASQCLELRALESGADINLTLEIGDERLVGSDGGIARYGLHLLVYCSPNPGPYTVKVSGSKDAPEATARIALRVWTEPEFRSAFWTLSKAFVALAKSPKSTDVGRFFQDSAKQLDSLRQEELAATAWTLAARHSEISLDRPRAAEAFGAAVTRSEALRWTRNQVVLLNNRALFIAQEDASTAQILIARAFRLQGALGDPLLSAAVENNLCLLRNEFGDLSSAEACFVRLLHEEEALGMRKSSIGAVRNNWALVQLKSGRYQRALDAFETSAAERLEGHDESGYIISVGNVALCLYQLGNVGAALTRLHAVYEFAKARGDVLGRAKIAEYIASIYMAWGDGDTANVFATEAESAYRENHRIPDLAQALRLRARIEAGRENSKAALDIVKAAWELAIDSKQMQSAANIAGVYADILLSNHDLAGAAAYIHDAKKILGQRQEAHDRLNLQVSELRVMRLSGRHSAAKKFAARLLLQVPYPGLTRTNVLIETFLLQVQERDDYRGLYSALLNEIRKEVAATPDPELVYHLLDIVRPAAESAIEASLSHCNDSSGCAEIALKHAMEYESLSPIFGDRKVAEPSELQGLLLSLSTLQARGEPSLALQQLTTRIKQLQSYARMQPVTEVPSSCTHCADTYDGTTQIVFFFGLEKSWRWHRDASTWRLRELPGWPVLAANLQAVGAPGTRTEALSALSLFADLPEYRAQELVVSGDERISQFPLSALRLNSTEDVVDKYALSVKIGRGRPSRNESASVSFIGMDASGVDELPMLAEERKAVSDWSNRVGLPFVVAGAFSEKTATLLHITAHGDRDLGDGLSVIWLKGRPLLSYLNGAGTIAETVVINACESGASSNLAFSQSSIASGFLRSGAKRVVATLFQVGDNAAATFSRVFYANYEPARGNLAAAVREGQLALRTSRTAGFAWAAYVLLASQDNM